MLKPYAGKPCKRGHKAPRYVANNACIECAKLATKKQYAAIRESAEAYKVHVSRQKATASAEPKSEIVPFRGKPCRRGHKAPRYLSNNSCVECVQIASRKHYEHRKSIECAQLRMEGCIHIPPTHQ